MQRQLNVAEGKAFSPVNPLKWRTGRYASL